MIGESKVGKSDIFYYIKNKKYNTKEDEKLSTTGIDLIQKTINEVNQSKTFQIWDTSGDERFRTMTKAYFRNALYVILCFELTKKKTFEALKEWVSITKKVCDRNYQILLLGNKNDLLNKIEVNQEEIDKFVNNYSNMTYCSCSAKTGDNIFEVLYLFTRKIRDIIENTNFKKEKIHIVKRKL